MARYTRRTVAIVAVAAVGFAGCGTGADDDPRPVDNPSGAPGAEAGSERPGPRDSRHGVPVGWPPGPDGARAAAISVVGLSGEIAKAGFITRGDMIDTLASRGFASELAMATERQLADLAEALGELEVLPPAVAWTEVPLTARVLDEGRRSARVEVWSVVVVASPDVGVPRQAWRTVTLDMVREDDDWKVDAWDTTPGPTPALAAATAVSSGRQVADVAGWPAAADVETAPEGGGG